METPGDQRKMRLEEMRGAKSPPSVARSWEVEEKRRIGGLGEGPEPLKFEGFFQRAPDCYILYGWPITQRSQEMREIMDGHQVAIT